MLLKGGQDDFLAGELQLHQGCLRHAPPEDGRVDGECREGILSLCFRLKLNHPPSKIGQKKKNLNLLSKVAYYLKRVTIWPKFEKFSIGISFGLIPSLLSIFYREF